MHAVMYALTCCDPDNCRFTMLSYCLAKEDSSVELQAPLRHWLAEVRNRAPACHPVTSRMC